GDAGVGVEGARGRPEQDATVGTVVDRHRDGGAGDAGASRVRAAADQDGVRGGIFRTVLEEGLAAPVLDNGAVLGELELWHTVGAATRQSGRHPRDADGLATI